MIENFLRSASSTAASSSNVKQNISRECREIVKHKKQASCRQWQKQCQQKLSGCSRKEMITFDYHVAAGWGVVEHAAQPSPIDRTCACGCFRHVRILSSANTDSSMFWADVQMMKLFVRGMVGACRTLLLTYTNETRHSSARYVQTFLWPHSC